MQQLGVVEPEGSMSAVAGGLQQHLVTQDGQGVPAGQQGLLPLAPVPSDVPVRVHGPCHQLVKTFSEVGKAFRDKARPDTWPEPSASASSPAGCPEAHNTSLHPSLRAQATQGCAAG